MFTTRKLKLDTNSTLLMIIIVIVVFIGLYVVFYNDDQQVLSKIDEVREIAAIPPPQCPDLECPACPKIPKASCPACPQQIPCPPSNSFMDIGNSLNTKCLKKCRDNNVSKDEIQEQKCIVDCNTEVDEFAVRVSKFVRRVEEGENPEDDEQEEPQRKKRLPTREEQYEMETPKEKVRVKEVIKYKKANCPPQKDCPLQKNCKKCKRCKACKICKPNIPCPKCRKCQKCKKPIPQKCKKFPSANEIMGGVFPGRLKKIEGGRHFPLSSFNESCPIRTEASIYDTPGGFNNSSIISITNDYFNSTVTPDNEELKRKMIMGKKIKQQKADPIEELKKRQRDPLRELEKKLKETSDKPKKLTKKKPKKMDGEKKKKESEEKKKEGEKKKKEEEKNKKESEEKKKVEEEKKKVEEEKKKVEEEKKMIEEEKKMIEEEKKRKENDLVSGGDDDYEELLDRDV